MSPPLSRQEAARVLGVPNTAGPRAVKQAYRRLVRQHHPDRGGDAGTFDRLRQAYERLVADEAPPPPTVARGRPSRAPAAFTPDTLQVATDGIDWARGAPKPGDPLSRDGLVILLAPSADGPLHAVTATSRAPGSRINRVAGSLSTSFTARLRITAAADDRGASVVRIEISGSSRRVRRTLDRSELDGSWTRTRGSSSTTLRTSIAPSPTVRATAVRAADVTSALLDRLGWPVGEWTVMSEGP